MRYKRLALFLPCLFFVLLCQSNSYSSSRNPQPILVEIKPESTVYYTKPQNNNAKNPKDIFYIVCTVRNISSENQEYWTWGGSYWLNWKTDNTCITIDTWGVGKNALKFRILKPGEVDQWKLPIKIDPAVSEGDIEFRLCFLPSLPSKEEMKLFNPTTQVNRKTQLKGLFWSNRIKISVKNKR